MLFFLQLAAGLPGPDPDLPVLRPVHAVEHGVFHQRLQDHLGGQAVGQLLRQLPQQLQPPVLPQDPAIVQDQQHRPGGGAQHKGIGHRPQRQLVQGEGGGEDAAEKEKRQQRPAPLPQISGQHGPHPTI